MSYRILADENVEQATINYLRTLGHDVVRVNDQLVVGADDRVIARYAREHCRLILTQDDDFLTELPVETVGGVLFQPDQTCSAQTVGDAIELLSQYLDQSAITVEYVPNGWV